MSYIEVASPEGTRQELTFEEEDGALFVELRDWETGETHVELTLAGTLSDFKAKVAAL